MAGVVGVACQDCTGAVELFGEDEAGEFVGHCDGAEREQQIGLGPGLFRPSVGGADGEDDVLDALIPAGAEPGGELGGAELAAAAIEQDGKRRQPGGFAGVGGTAEPGEERGFGSEGFGLDRDIRVDSVEIEAGERFK